ncbi:MAG: hypothetical protein KAX11_06700 [Candidatus Aminicenantes bacterium]|nr:hypothetical protein [Candidatus Aminicenantes bacterium]
MKKDISADIKLIAESVDLMLKSSKEQLKKLERARNKPYYLPEDKILRLRVSCEDWTACLDNYRNSLNGVDTVIMQSGRIKNLRRKIRQLGSLIKKTGNRITIIEKKSSKRKEIDHSQFIKPERRKELEKGIRDNPFQLPPGVTMKKEIMTDGNQAWEFRHRDLGRLGRISLKAMGGQTLIINEAAGDQDDPLTAKRKEIFEPIARELSARMEKILGKGKGAPPKHIEIADEPPMPVAINIIQCETCGEPAALMVFADQAKTPDEMEDYARMMYRQLADRNLPAWILGCALTDPDEDPDAPSYAMKVWPEKERIQLVTPDQILPEIDEAVENHCKKDSLKKDPKREQLNLVKKIDDFVRNIEAAGGGEEKLLENLYHHMYNFYKLMKLCSEDELNFFTKTHPGFGRYAHMINNTAGALRSGFIKENADGSFS